jgi:GNAT superfamily N-acetyltransferase
MRLTVANDSERRARDAVTFGAWGGRLSLGQYLEREVQLRGTAWASEAMETWLWLDRAGAVLSSCETFRCESQVGSVRGHSWAIASVFTEAARRGQGHATALIGAVCEELKKRPAAQTCVLFSEVGASLYESSQFHECPSFDWVAPAHDVALEAPATLLSDVPAGFPEAAGELSSQQLKVFASPGQLDWHLARERFYTQALKRSPLTGRGVRVGTVEAVWMEYAKTRELLVLWTNARTERETAAVLRVAQKVAFDAGLTQVRLWETVPLKKAVGLRVTRNDELPMYRSLGSKVTEWVDIQRVHWV